jgi:hypothetical protein
MTLEDVKDIYQMLECLASSLFTLRTDEAHAGEFAEAVMKLEGKSQENDIQGGPESQEALLRSPVLRQWHPGSAFLPPVAHCPYQCLGTEVPFTVRQRCSCLRTG